MKFLIIASALTLVGSCATQRYSDRITSIANNIQFNDIEKVQELSNSITPEELKDHVYTIASDEFEGRKVGELGHQKVVDYIKNYYIKEKVPSPVTQEQYLQHIPESHFGVNIKSSDNVIAFISGSEFPDEVVIISAHSDHLGTVDREIFHGADDNASGTSALLEIAQAFKLAKDKGLGPRRSIAFLHLTGEEIGLTGSSYFIDHPLFPLENAVADLNVDMVGRVDEAHKNDPNYVYIIGADRLSTELHYISEKANSTFTKLKLDYKYNAENDQNRYYYRSDHYNFARNNIPVIFYFNGEHEDYHQPTDTPEKINYELLAKRTKLIFVTAWYLANSDSRLSLENLP